nr:long chain acyl-CoA synthetase 1-like [Tanacetum cinerariifolium]
MEQRIEYTGSPETVTTVVSDATNTKKTSHAGSDYDEEARDPNAVPADFASQEAKVWEAKSKPTERIWKKRKGIAIKGDYSTFLQTLEELHLEYTMDAMTAREMRENYVKMFVMLRGMHGKQWEEFLQVDAQRRQQRMHQPMAAYGFRGYKQDGYSKYEYTVGIPYVSNNMPMDLRVRYPDDGPKTRLGMIGETLSIKLYMDKEISVKVEDGRKGAGDGDPSVGPVYRNVLAKQSFPPLDPNFKTAWDVFRSSVEKYPNNKMLGWRELDNGKWGPYIWKTYKTVYEEVLNVAYAIMASGLQPGCKVGIYGANCPQWIVAMEACNAQGLICVPLYDTLGAGAVNFILEHAEIDIVFVQDKKVNKLLDPECIHTRCLKTIVCFTAMEDEEKEKADSMGIKSFSWIDFLHMGIEHPSELQTPQATDICMIMYTSGTNGDPKGVILTHENAITNISGIDIYMEQFEDKMTADDVYLSFLPLAHILDRIIEEYFFRKGASVGFYHGDINAIRDDMMELKPTFLAGVPRVLERIYEGVLKGLEELNPRRRKIFDILYNYKLKWMKSGYKHKYASPFADMLAFNKVKNKLGGRIRCIVSGGAPLSPEVEEFLRVTSCAFVVQGYGLTETCGLAAVAFPDEMRMVGTVGNPFVYMEIRLEEVPEMDYDPLAYPSRGEICLRGRTPFAGYYKNPELTNEVMRDGWFHTGDIGEMLPNGSLKIIDRKKHLIKLSQGEYVALEHLEKVYGITPIVEDIWVYGDSFKSSLVAVVVPNHEQVEKWADQNGHKSSFSDLCMLTQLRDYILRELKSTAERNKLRGFEQIKGVIVEAETFEGEKGLLTATLKKKRDKLLNNYKVQIDNLYTKVGENKY